MTMSVPYGLPSTCSSIQLSSTSSSSGSNASAPSTPKPPARLTAATTSRQWENAKIGNSIPSRSQIGVRTRRLLQSFELVDNARRQLAQVGCDLSGRVDADRQIVAIAPAGEVEALGADDR